MYRLVSMLLIPFFVLGHALPHSHAGTGIVEPSGHDLRPHVHLHSHGHEHAHSHGDHVHASPPSKVQSAVGDIVPVADHDADAVYLGAASQSVTRPSDSVSIENGVGSCFIGRSVWYAETVCLHRTGPPPNQCGSLPIYLLTASLRL